MHAPRCWCRWAGRLWRASIAVHILHMVTPMHKHIQHLASYCESIWTLRTHTRTNAHRPYEYRRRKTEQEAKEARLQRALTGSLNTGLMPSSSLCTKGGAGATNFAGDFYLVMGGGGGSRPSPIHGHAQPRTATNSPSHVHRGPLSHDISTCMPHPQTTGMRYL